MTEDHAPDAAGSHAGPALLSDQPTVELVLRVRAGDQSALAALLERCLPPLKRWAHGRLPAIARANIDTGDLVQEAAINAIRNLDTFQPRNVGAMQAYLRRSVINRIRDEIRRVSRRGPAPETFDDLQSSEASPLERAIEHESYERYRQAVMRLRPRDREVIIGRLEAQWSATELAMRLGFNTSDAARLATIRALKRLAAEIKRLEAPRNLET